ncbi:MAG TPA: hypothetical protein ENK42_06265 [Deltaproteobacteria bacterium]|nr:hypothetical protein [Deltaproteobacteria bacterium]
MRYLLLILMLLLQPAMAGGEDFIIIVNKHGPLVNADVSTVRDIYLGEKRFARNTKLMPVHMVEGSLKESFLKRVVGMSPKEYKLHWVKKVFQEGITPPPSMASVADIIALVSKDRGAIAYIPAGYSKYLVDVVVIGP